MFAPEVGKLNGGGVVRSFEVTLDLHVTIVRVQHKRRYLRIYETLEVVVFVVGFLGTLVLSSPNT